VVKGGKKIRKDTKTHQDRWVAIDPDTCALIAEYLDETRSALAAVGAELPADAYHVLCKQRITARRPASLRARCVPAMVRGDGT
jgi:hypothetical protein